MQVNAHAPAVLAHEAAALGAWLVHYSTDYVFDGSGEHAWREGDVVAPLSVYGSTKHAGECAVAGYARHLIFRTSWVYGARGGNFARTMLRLAQSRETLSVVCDQIGAPTSAELLADVTAHAVRRVQSHAALAGLYHCAASGQTSWHGYAQHVLRKAQTLGWELKAGPDQVHPISSAQYPTPARRPLNSRLDCTLLQDRFDLVLPHWQAGVDRMLEEISGRA